ncbi:zinc ribbon domain-containing protein [Pelomonas sp. KK5]|uniref:zinc ribbon domain-containing protein n=1 Tax=Pelomonas sp. KK5 TaxID=1855730 RepID=UPI00097C65FE|nr:zinc ribbon domain-containing protein [Pelomonas sp. KK5]
MSYDYSSESARLEIPNPYKVQNRLLFLCAALLVAAGLWCVTSARESLSKAPIAVGIALLAFGILSASTAAKRLRFFFGRGRPLSLAPDLAPTVVGTSPRAEYHKGLLRQGALEYPEPKGALDGVLYHAAPHLITAPDAVQLQARVHFFNFAALAVTLLSFAFAWLVFGNAMNRPWLSLAYFAFGFIFLLKPILSSSPASLSLPAVIALIVGAILGPALVGAASKVLPALHWSLAPQTTVMLLSALAAVALSMLAVLGQVKPPPATQTSSEQLRLSLNVPPSLLIDELERRLQEQWTEKIPNRRYARQVPVIDPQLHSGPFSGELFEESQPMPMSGTTPAGIGQALGSRTHKWLAVLDLFATLLVLAGVIAALMFVRQFGDPSSFDSAAERGSASFSWLGSASILLLVATFCFKSSARLWGRFDFESVLVWVEMAGTYMTASVGTGNMVSARVQTSNQIVRTEAMTLRIWRARIESVVFGKDERRQVTAMFSSDAGTRELAQHLAEFGQSRASLVAPGSQADAERLQALGAAERLVGNDNAAPQIRLAPEPASAPALAASFCRKCGAGLAGDDLFCSKCGTKVHA